MPKKLSQKQVIIIGFGFIIVVLIGIIFYFNIRHSNTATQANLIVWGTDPEVAMTSLFNAYSGVYQGATIAYKRFDPDTYQTQLLSALAAGTGPDIFEIDNQDLASWENVISPMPTTNAEQFNLISLQNDFPTVVGQDLVDSGNIYSLPLSLDTLAMYYNKDLIDSAGIAQLPKTWDDFDADVTRLRSLNAQGQIVQAGAALGGSRTSIKNAPDIIYLLMLQNGTQMTTPDFSSAIFAGGVGSSGNPGIAAFNFYLQFSNAASPYYTWNDSFGDAESAFIQGKSATMFDYAAEANQLKQKAPFLNYGIAAMPQPTGANISVNYPRYKGLVVTRAGQVAAAWDFLINLSTNADIVGVYNKVTGTPPALRSAIQINSTDPVLSIFGAQALSARSWHEADAEKIDNLFNAAIVSVLSGAADSTKALQTAQAGVNAIINSQ